MTQNLRLGGDSPITLTSVDSDVSSSFLLPKSSLAFNGSGPVVYIDSSRGNLYGGFYNYLAATAGTNSSSYSICPKGWHIPNGSDATSITQTYNYAQIKQSPANWNHSGWYETDNSHQCCETCSNNSSCLLTPMWLDASNSHILFLNHGGGSSLGHDRSGAFYYQTSSWGESKEGWIIRCLAL